MTREITQFIDQLRGKARSTYTLKAYESDLLIFDKWYHDMFGDRNSANATEVEALAYYKYLATQYLDSSIRRKFTALSGYFDYLIKTGRRTTNPTVKIEMPKVERRPAAILSDTALMALWGQMPPDRPGVIRDIAIFRLMLFMGLKLSKIVDLKIGDWRADGSLWAGGQWISVPPIVCQDIERWLPLRKEGEYLFQNHFGKKISTRSIRRRLNAYTEAAGIGHVNSHILRAAYASSRLNSGADANDIARAMGYKNIHAVDQYRDPQLVRI